MAAVAIVVFVNGSCHQRRRQLDGGTMTQWQPWQWRLLPMVAGANAVIVVHYVVAVDAAATNPIGIDGGCKDAIAANAIN